MTFGWTRLQILVQDAMCLDVMVVEMCANRTCMACLPNAGRWICTLPGARSGVVVALASAARAL